MTKAPKPRIVHRPSDDEMTKAFDDYALALGKVIYAWNYLLEKMGELFVVVVGDADREILLQIWHVSDSDRVRIDMLKAAATASSSDRWGARLPGVTTDVLCLVNQAVALIDARNDAAHGLVTLWVDVDHSVIGAHPGTKHKRAAGLRRRGDLLVEFDRLERWAKGLTDFARKAETALYPTSDYPWPGIPGIPTRRLRKDLPSQRTKGEANRLPASP